MESNNYELSIGLKYGGNIHKEVELLVTNGVAEKVFVKKLPEKPYTWQGNVLSIAIARIGSIEVGASVREKYLKDGIVTIPDSVLSLPLADVNTSLLEIHRRAWEDKLPRQEVLCKYCHKKLTAEIDLFKIDYLPEAKEVLENSEYSDFETTIVELAHGITPTALGKLTESPEYEWAMKMKFDKIHFRIPTLRDAIRHEAYIGDSILFWRRIALDCIVDITGVNASGNLESMPQQMTSWYGLRLFDQLLSGKDLKRVRQHLTEYFPTLPFAYYELCGCEDNRMIPMVMEASSFFSE